MNLNKTKAFKKILIGILVLGLVYPLPACVWAAETASAFTEESGTFYQEVFDQAFFQEGVNQLDLSRWGRKLFRKKIPSANINLFDEVPDSALFTNRHAKARLSPAELERGYRETEGPDLSQPLIVLAVEQRGLISRFLVEDAKKETYLLKFDTQGHKEMTTSAEVIASRFYYAIGYHVPQYTILSFKLEQIQAGGDAVVFDNTGFKKTLTPKLLGEYLITIPQMPDGTFRASAKKLISGKGTETFSFSSRKNPNDPDPTNLRDRREVRGLGVFAAWLNNDDVRASLVTPRAFSAGDKPALQWVLSNFTTALGASQEGEKSAMMGYEYMVDYGETFKTFLALGLREKPWQKIWREENEKQHPLEAVGYFSNKHFNPAKYKVQLPHDAFRMITRADGFWATRIILSFSDEDIRAMVKAAAYSDPAASDYIAKTLIERRDLIGKYWCSQASPLDQFSFSQGVLAFKNLALDHSYSTPEGMKYQVDIIPEGKKKEKLASSQTSEATIPISTEWFSQHPLIRVTIQAARPSEKKPSASVSVVLNASGIQGIQRQD